MKRSTLNLLLTVLMIPMLHACGGNSEEDQGSVRLVNATTNFGALDAYRDDTGMVNTIASGTASGYANLDKDSYTFKIAKSGLGTTAASVTGDVSDSNHYALVAYATGSSLQVSYLGEDETAPSSGQAKLRFMNTASVEAGSVDIYVGHTACSALTSTDIAAASAVSTAAVTGFTAFTAGTYSVCVTAAGSKTDVRLDIPALPLGNQQIGTLVLTRSTSGVLVHGLLLNQQGSLDAHANLSGRVRVVANPLAGATTTTVANGTTLSSLAPAASIGGYKLVTAGALTVTVNGAAVDAGGATVTAGTDMTLLVTGNVASPTLSVIPDDNTLSTSTSQPVKLRLVNGVNGLTSSVTMTLESDVIGDDVAFGTASAPVTVGATTENVDIAVTNGSTVLFTTQQTLSANKVYTVFLLGDTSTVTTSSKFRSDR